MTMLGKTLVVVAATPLKVSLARMLTVPPVPDTTLPASAAATGPATAVMVTVALFEQFSGAPEIQILYVGE
jgi:hypothetical protein